MVELHNVSTFKLLEQNISNMGLVFSVCLEACPAVELSSVTGTCEAAVLGMG